MCQQDGHCSIRICTHVLIKALGDSFHVYRKRAMDEVKISLVFARFKMSYQARAAANRNIEYSRQAALVFAFRSFHRLFQVNFVF